MVPTTWVALLLSALGGAITAYPFHLWLGVRGLASAPGLEPDAAGRGAPWFEAIVMTVVGLAALVTAIGVSLVVASGVTSGELARAILGG
jgi:hypothetical protein